VDLGAVLGWVTAALIAVGVLLWRLVGTGAEQATKAQVDELMVELNRQSVLARELEKTRGTERQELRFESYGTLWAEMRPLAIYDTSPINAEEMGTLSSQLTGWYFSAKGGLMLTSHNRDLYFALQDLVQAVGSKPDWQAKRIGKPKDAFQAVAKRLDLAGAQELMKLLDGVKVSEWPPSDLVEVASGWRKKDVVLLVDRWGELDEGERFAVLQQAASLLRTGLTYDVESRLR
jgi:hypothetical protein